jgi:hypothetical protein
MAQRIRGEPVVQRKGGAIGDRDEGKAGARNGKNEEDGGEDGKRARRVGLYGRSGGRGTILERGALNRFA